MHLNEYKQAQYWFSDFWAGSWGRPMNVEERERFSSFVFSVLLTLIYPAHFEDVPCQSGVNHIYEG